MIFKESSRQSVIPSDWRRANATPFLKKVSRQSAANYRPVSLTSVVCKLLETITVTKHLYKHFSLLNKRQHGFILKSSCLTNVLEYCDIVIGMLDEGDPVDIVHEDFQKALIKFLTNV